MLKQRSAFDGFFQMTSFYTLENESTAIESFALFLKKKANVKSDNGDEHKN